MLPDPTSPLDTFITPEPLGNGAFAFTFPDGWQQGRGAFGGLVVAALVRAVEATVQDGRTLRSLTAELCGPTLPGMATIQTEVLRAGNAVSTLAARLMQGEELQAHAVAVLGQPRTTDCDVPARREMPPLAWHDTPVLEIGPPLGPHFARYLEFRNTGPLPFSGAEATHTSGWVRPRYAHKRDAAWIAACADAWWPVLFASQAAPRPMATIAFSLQMLCDPMTLDPQAPLYHIAHTKAVHEGYAVEFRELWTHDMRLVALNEQTIAVIK
jgi:hypothetical protein